MQIEKFSLTLWEKIHECNKIQGYKGTFKVKEMYKRFEQ